MLQQIFLNSLLESVPSVTFISILLVQWFFVNVVGDRLLKVRISIQFLVKLDGNAADIYILLLQFYGEAIMTRT
jgi:hypothetical protein